MIHLFQYTSLGARVLCKGVFAALDENPAQKLPSLTVRSCLLSRDAIVGAFRGCLCGGAVVAVPTHANVAQTPKPPRSWRNEHRAVNKASRRQINEREHIV